VYKIEGKLHLGVREQRVINLNYTPKTSWGKKWKGNYIWGYESKIRMNTTAIEN
jgi:hypothetical protein